MSWVLTNIYYITKNQYAEYSNMLEGSYVSLFESVPTSADFCSHVFSFVNFIISYQWNPKTRTVLLWFFLLAFP